MVCERQASNFNNSTNTHNKKTLERALRGVRCNPAPTLTMPLCSIMISMGNLHKLVQNSQGSALCVVCICVGKHVMQDQHCYEQSCLGSVSLFSWLQTPSDCMLTHISAPNNTKKKMGITSCKQICGPVHLLVHMLESIHGHHHSNTARCWHQMSKASHGKFNATSIFFHMDISVHERGNSQWHARRVYA